MYENETNIKCTRKCFLAEWSSLSKTHPVYGGSFYIRWGRKTCPPTSTFVYRGQMTGPSWLSEGGGPNWQCLPEDPEYNTNTPRASNSFLRAAHYRIGGSVQDHRIPCTVCETMQRVSQLMIPGKTRCPTSEWTLEYSGYMVSSAETESHSEDFKTSNYFRGNYVCVDERPESLTSRSHGRAGPQLYYVLAACGDKVSGALNNCPPYKHANALSCVVCSK